MADLTIPLRQTYPFIRGYVADDEGDMSDVLASANALSLVLDDGTGGTPLEITVEHVTGQTMTVNGQDVPVNFQGDYSASALASSETNWRGKLKIQHDSGGNHVQYCPKDGFLEIEIGPNVTEA